MPDPKQKNHPDVKERHFPGPQNLNSVDLDNIYFPNVYLNSVDLDNIYFHNVYFNSVDLDNV
jgi:hypothetical protein